MRSDKELLDFLQELNNKADYTGDCVLRQSCMGRGWRLHETDPEYRGETSSSVREAIDSYMTKEKTCVKQ